MAKTYPATVSRTLDPSNKSLVTVVAMHDHQLTDADLNLIQDTQDLKRQRLLNDQVTSGCLTYTPMQFRPFVDNTFLVPSFDVLFNGEVVTVTGWMSSDATMNRIQLPAPSPWRLGDAEEPARLYVVFLELWYQSLNAETGDGYYRDSGNSALHYFYPYGCVNPDPTLAESMPDDSVFFSEDEGGLFTTQRAQIQWRFNVQRVALTYDFSMFQYGLDPGARPTEIVYAQASLSSPIVDTPFQFVNMGTITGDTGVWRAGDGVVSSDGTPANSLRTMDGYSYAMPVAVVFQRNSGTFSLDASDANLFGCAKKGIAQSGLLQSRASGRMDSKLADQIFPDDVVDVRHTISLGGWNYDGMMREGFVNLITGTTRNVIARGEAPGMDVNSLGSTQGYIISMSSSPVANTHSVGSWDGFANGFSSDERAFFVTKQITTYDKSIVSVSGVQGARWSLNDAFTITLPPGTPDKANISSIVVQAMVTDSTGKKSPVNLLQGQVDITPLPARSVTVTFRKDLSGTPFDPGSNNIYATLGVTYPAGTGVHLQKTPMAVEGGYLIENSKQIPVFGVSEYDVQAQQLALQANAVWAVNPEYGSVIFGTKVWVAVPGSQGTQIPSGGTTVTTFQLDRTNLNNDLSGTYVTRAWDSRTGNFYQIVNRSLYGNTHTLTVQGAVPSDSTVVVSYLAQNTAQLVYNAPVKGVTEIEETVLFGTLMTDATFQMDSRVVVESVTYDQTTDLNTVILAAKNCIIKGIAGDDVLRLIWVKDVTGHMTAVSFTSANFNNGTVVITVPGNAGLTNLTQTAFFFVGSILPAFDASTSLVVALRYVPYQGEGVQQRDYEVLHTEDNALVTTNGTGAAPIPGIADVYPYKRDFPLITALPSQCKWNDATMANTPLATFFDSNYEAMRMNNVEHTFLAPLHTNDFIQPLNKDMHKQIRMLSSGVGGRGFAKAIPHVGFAIRPPVARTVLGQNLQSTTQSITLYVNNSVGRDSNDGLTPSSAKQSLAATLAVLPPVLRHPCSIQFIDTGTAYSINSLPLQTVALGDGDVLPLLYYALGNIGFHVQDEGRLVITAVEGATNPIVIDAAGYVGDGTPTSAFFIDNTRVIFRMLEFDNFVSPAIKGIDSDIIFVDCVWKNNIQMGSFEQGCGVVLQGGTATMPSGGTGFVLAQSELTAKGTNLTVASGANNPGAFFVAERQSTLNLEAHGVDTLQEVNIQTTTVIAEAQLNSSIVLSSDFQSNGMAVLTSNSTLARTVKVNPFLGGINKDDSSNVTTQL